MEQKKVSKENQKLINFMINKSQDSFLLAIELYNKYYGEKSNHDK